MVYMLSLFVPPHCIPSDFVLCYKKDPNETEDGTDGADVSTAEDDKKKHAEKRHWFLEWCKQEGLQYEKQHCKVWYL